MVALRGVSVSSSIQRFHWIVLTCAIPLLVGTGAVRANALGIDDVSPLYFAGAGGFGHTWEAVDAAGLPIIANAPPLEDWIIASSVFSISVTLNFVHQDPQRRGASPSFVDPLIADVRYTVTNISGETLVDPFLVFTAADLSSGDYPGLSSEEVGLGGEFVDIIRYQAGGTDYFFSAYGLPELIAGASAQIDVRYLVADTLPQIGNNLLFPTFGVSVLVNVPEPRSVWFVGLGLLALALARAFSPSRSASS